MGRGNGDSAHDWLNALLTTVASALLSSLPFVAMVESTDLRQFNHSSHSWRLDRSRNRSIFGQTQMSSRSFVIIEVSAENALQPSLVEDEQVIETITPDRAHQSLDISILPRRAWSREDLPNLHRCGRLRKRL